MSEKHTPGPWVTLKRFGSQEITSINGELICVLASTSYSDHVPGNTHLIAAAPELLAALEAITAITDRNHVAWDKARAVIAKAKGEVGFRRDPSTSG